MPITRVPLAATIATRNSGLDKDSLLYNCFSEKEANGDSFSVRRFGLTPYLTFAAGQALGLFVYNNLPISIIGSRVRIGNTILFTGVNTLSPYQFSPYNAEKQLFVKNNAIAYYYDGSVFNQVTDVDYPPVTVPGVVALDQTMYVMSPDGKIWGSALNDPTNWSALNVISANTAPDAGVAISKLYNYVVGFCANSTMLFYDNANPTPGSPLSANISAVINVGCACATSVVQTKNTVFWIGRTHQKGRSVYVFNGLNPQVVSNQYIDRILNADDLSSVYAYFIEIEGHAFYILTLKKSNVTLVYDMLSNDWAVWSSTALSPTSTQVTNSLVLNGTVTLTAPAHGLVNGDIVKVTGSASPGFLGDIVPYVIDSNTISYPLNTSQTGGINSLAINVKQINGEGLIASTGSITGPLTVTKYVQNTFSSVFYTGLTNNDLLLDETSGTIYNIAEGLADDNGQFIYTALRTNGLDFGSNKRKFFHAAEVVADKVTALAYLGYSDNDFVSYSYFRPINLNAARSQLRKLSMARRRSFKLIYIGPYQIRFYGLELHVDEGQQ